MTDLKVLMQTAHKLAKKFTGNYQARLALALKLVWASVNKTGNGMMKKFNKVLVHYAEYKNNYKNHMKGEYNPETKQIEIYVLKDKYLTEAALVLERKLNEINKIDITTAEKMDKLTWFIDHQFKNDYRTELKTVKARMAELRAVRA